MLAVIAGTGFLPIEACKQLTIMKRPFFVVSLFPEDNFKQLNAASHDNAIAQSYCKAGEILNLLEQHNTTEVLLIGKVDKRNLLKKVSLDWISVKLLASILYKNDTAIMQLVVDELAQRGISVIKQDAILQSLLMPPGIVTGNVSETIQQDINLGLHVAQQLSTCDIGQTIVVKDKMVVAAEAIEGTDECIKRGIMLGKKDVVICKAARIDQNKQFDLPTLGPQSLNYLSKGQVKAIAWQSSQTLIAQSQEFIRQARALGITLISVDTLEGKND